MKSLCANSNHARGKMGEPHKGLSQRQPQETCADLIAGKKEGFLRNMIQWMDRVHPELSFQEFTSSWTLRTPLVCPGSHARKAGGCNMTPRGQFQCLFFFFKDSTLEYTFSCLLIHQAV